MFHWDNRSRSAIRYNSGNRTGLFQNPIPCNLHTSISLTFPFVVCFCIIVFWNPANKHGRSSHTAPRHYQPGKAPAWRHEYSRFIHTVHLQLQQAEHFCNSIGILQQFSTPSKFPNFDRTGSQTPQQSSQEDYAQVFSTLISRCAKDIDTIIESLPNEDCSQELQFASLLMLEQENKEAAERLEEVVRRGEALLEKVQEALSDIAQAQLDFPS